MTEFVDTVVACEGWADPGAQEQGQQGAGAGQVSIPSMTTYADGQER